MPLWDNSRFEKEAKDIARTWYDTRTANGSSLTTLVTKVARDAALNPEQIARLARITNGHAFNAIFDAAKTAKEKDRYPDFDVADEKAVIAALYESAAQPVIKTASYDPLQDRLAAFRERPDPLKEHREKTAMDKAVKTIAEVTRAVPAGVRFHNYKAAYDATRAKAVGCEQRWYDAMADLHKVASQRGWNRGAFEAQAVASFGSKALTELNLLRKEAGLALLQLSEEKVAFVQDRVVPTLTSDVQVLQRAIHERESYMHWKTSAEVAQQRLSQAKEELYARPATQSRA